MSVQSLLRLARPYYQHPEVFFLQGFWEQVVWTSCGRVHKKIFGLSGLGDSRVNIAKGFMDRCFAFRCTRGSSQYDIKEVTNPAGDNEFTDLLNELLHHRKLLFAFRLLHYQDPLPNIELSVKNREKQLCKPVLRLF